MKKLAKCKCKLCNRSRRFGIIVSKLADNKDRDFMNEIEKTLMYAEDDACFYRGKSRDLEKELKELKEELDDVSDRLIAANECLDS